LQLHDQNKPFAEIRSSLHVLERIASSVKCKEPVLLVGETGTGKTTLVQYLAMKLGQKLTVLVYLLSPLSLDELLYAWNLLQGILTVSI
jgi:midasin (ATPase involved in ribosome maturation)